MRAARTHNLLGRSSWVTIALLCIAPPVFGAEFHGVSSPPDPREAVTIARDHIHRQSPRLRLHDVQLVNPRVSRTALTGHQTVRMHQIHQGLPVLGASAAVRIDQDGSVVMLMLDVLRGLDVEIRSDLTFSDARRRVEAHVGRPLPAGTRHELAVVGDWHPARLAWLVLVPSLDGGTRYVVDAHSGRLLRIEPMGRRAFGRVYPLHPVATPMTEDRRLEDLVPSNPQRLTGWGGNLRVTQFVHSAWGDSIEQTLGPSSGDDFLYDPPAEVMDPTDAFAQVNAYYHLTRARDLFAELGAEMAGPQWSLVASVNVLENGKPFDGAFYSPMGLGPPWSSPNFMGFGQGRRVDFAYDADAYVHEFTHYVNHNAVGFNAGQFAFDELGLSPFSLVIDEGLADYFACSSAGDPVVGEASLQAIGRARDLSDDSLRCPRDIGGEGHHDGVLVGSLGWTLRQQLGSAVADSLMWTATTLLPYGATYGDFARGILQGAQELSEAGHMNEAEHHGVREALRTRGLDDCDRVIGLPVGETRRTLVFGLDSVGLILGSSCEELRTLGSLPSLFQFRTQLDGGAGIRFDVTLSSLSEGDLDWSLFVRADEPVGLAVGDPIPVPVVRDFDHALRDIRDPFATIRIDHHSDPPFDPSSSYHIVITHKNCPGVEAAITATRWDRSGEEAEPQLSSSIEVGGGCGCGVATRHRGTYAFLLLLAMASRVRRRWGSHACPLAILSARSSRGVASASRPSSRRAEAAFRRKTTRSGWSS